MAMRAPVVVLGPAEVADVGIESAVDRQVVQRDLAEVALADEVRLLCAGAQVTNRGDLWWWWWWCARSPPA